MDIVINASPLILLSKVDRLHLLNKIYTTVYIPSAVLQEIQEVGKPTVKLDQLDFNQLEISNKIAVLGLLGKLHTGEVEVMIGAIEKGVSKVALDENAARNKAKQLGLDVVGTLGILLGGHKLGLVDNLEQEFANLKNAGMYLSDEIIAKIMASN